MTDDELHEHITALQRAQTDFRHVEAKCANWSLPKRIWETLSAFANSPGGGVIILGLEEQAGFKPTGVQDAGKLMQDLGAVAADMDPRLSPVIDIKEIDGKQLVVAEVPELLPNQKPCYYRPSGYANGAFIRVADGDRKLNSHEVQMMLASRGQPVEDLGPVVDATVDDLDRRAIEAFLAHVRTRRARFRTSGDEQILRAHKVLVPHPADDSRVVPSMAGILVFGREPQTFFPQLAVLFTAYPGSLIGELGPHNERMLDDARIEGSISALVAQSLTAIQRNLRKPRIDIDSARIPISEIPVAALSEAVINALVHRDLSAQSRGTAVQIQLFNDRLVVINPGGLFGPVTVDTLGTGGISSARNCVLMQLLEDAIIPGTGEAIVEHRGTGIPVMMQALREVDMSPPRFEDNIGTFQVTFPRQSLIDPDTLAWLASLGPAVRELSRDQRMALALMKTGEVLTNARYRQIGGIDSRVASRELVDLVARGLAETAGGGRYTEYLLASHRPESGRRSTPGDVPTSRFDRRAEIRDLLATRGEVSRADLQRELGVTQAAVSRWLRRMLDDSEIVISTKSEKNPATKYRLRQK